MGNRESESGSRATRAQHTASLTFDLGSLAPAVEPLQGLSLTFGWRRLREEGRRGVEDFGLALSWGYQF
jgi:hypothetical protein